MEHNKTLRIWGGFLLLLLLTVVFLIWNLFAGSVRLSASEIWPFLGISVTARSLYFCSVKITEQSKYN